MQFAIGDVLGLFGRLVGFPDDRDRIAPLGKMTVEAIGGDIERAVGEPAHAEIGLREAAVVDPGREGRPIEALGLVEPEAGRIGERARIHLMIARGIHLGARRPCGWHRIDRVFAHPRPLVWIFDSGWFP